MKNNYKNVKGTTKMTHSNSGKRYIAASILTLCVMMAGSSYATDIHGIRPDGNGVYNIDPSGWNGNVGYRWYKNFNLSEGDIANLIFKYGEHNVSKFVNLVDNTININGLVNTMRDGKFYNGNAIFISPNGMVVGASGVLNVGSLTVLTPDQDSYDHYKGNRYETAQLFQSQTPVMTNGTGTVTINGKVIARDNIDIQAADIALNSGAAMLAGVKDSTPITSETQAQLLFESIVNTSNMNAANQFVSDNGNVSIRAYGADGGVKIAGDITNYGNGNIKVDNTGSKGIAITETGNTSNRNGDTTITNTGAGGITIDGTVTNAGTGKEMTVDGMVDHTGKVLIKNSGANGLTVNGKVSSTGKDSTTDLINETGALTVNGDVSASGERLTLNNTGSGLKIGKTGTVNFKYDAEDPYIPIGGTLNMINTGADGMVVDGSVNSQTTLNMKNSGLGGVVVNGTTKAIMNNITNSGAKGVTVNGLVEGYAGGVSANDGIGNVDIENTAGTVTVNGTVKNTGNTLKINNTGDGIVVNSTGKLDSIGALDVYNSGANGILVDGTISNVQNPDSRIPSNGYAVIKNDAGNIDVNGSINTTGHKLSILNNGNAINISKTGTVNNTGEILIDNTGAGGITVDGTVDNNNGNMLVKNTGANGLTVNGKVKNRGKDSKAELINESGMLSVNGSVSQSGENLTLKNTGSGLKIGKNGNVDFRYDATNPLLAIGGSLDMINTGAEGLVVDGNAASSTTMNTINSGLGGVVVNGTTKAIMNNITNSGAKGVTVNGLVEGYAGGVNANNGLGYVDIENTAGTVTVNGTVKNTGNTLKINNTGDGIVVNSTGKLDSIGALDVYNSGANGILVDGTISNAQNPDSILPSNGYAVIKNDAGNIDVNGKISTFGNKLSMLNNGNAINISETGTVKNTGELLIDNTGAGGINIAGKVENSVNKATINNTGANGINIASSGKVTNDNLLKISNTGANGINVKGITKSTGLKVYSKDGNVVIGDNTDNDFYMTSTMDADFDLENASLLNYGVAKTLINANGDLNIKATDGTIGKEIGPCDGGVCTGVGPAERDLTKSVNFKVDGNVNAETSKSNKTDDLVINMASLNADMHADRIKADGRVILLADATEKGAKAYNVVNRASDNTKANIEGKGISIIASGDIGEDGKALTFKQNEAEVNIANEDDDANQPHDLIMDKDGNLAPIHKGQGVEMLAIGNINVKGLDNADGTKSDTNVCTIASRTGSVNAEFSGDTYIRDITAKKEVKAVTRGSEMYIENLGGAPSRYAKTGDYYGDYTGINPEKATLKALDLGTKENPNLVPNSTIVVKNGTINGKGSTSHPDMDQDVTVTADNAYIGGYYFNMGKHRMPGLSSITKDDRTNPLENTNADTPVSIRARAVRPDDVTDIDIDPETRIYYYGKDEDDPNGGGSGQKDDPTFDKDKEDGDDLVAPTKATEPTGDTGDTTPTVPTEDTGDTTPTTPTDDTGDTTPTTPTDDTGDTTPTDPTKDTGDTTPTVPTNPTEPTDPTMDKDSYGEEWGKNIRQRVADENFMAIDKRQYMRFNVNDSSQPITLAQNEKISSLIDISRGGIAVKHNNDIKVGDVIPVNIKCADLDIAADVKVVTANDVKAGAEFINLDQVTADRLLYLNMLLEKDVASMN